MKSRKAISFLLSILLVFTMVSISLPKASAFEYHYIDDSRFSFSGGHFGYIKEDDSLWMWGYNKDGIIGDGTTNNVTEPKKIMDGVKSITCDGQGTVALKKDGSLWAWGTFWREKNNIERVPHPTPEKIMDDVKSYSVGPDTVGIILNDDSLWMWGNNDWGQIGDGSYNRATMPVHVMDDVASISCALMNTAAVKKDGALWLWGANTQHQVNGSGSDHVVKPTKVLDDVKSVVTCGGSTAAIKKDNSLWMWGDNENGVVGIGTTSNVIEPKKIIDSVESLDMTERNVAVVRKDGTLWVWGDNSAGQIGDQTQTPRWLPQKVDQDVVSVSLGNRHTAIIKTDGSLRITGDNGFGQCGEGRKSSLMPTTEPYDGGCFTYFGVASSDAAHAEMKGYSSALIKKDGSLWAWGFNLGQISNSTEQSVYSPVMLLGPGSIPVRTGNKEFQNNVTPVNPETPSNNGNASKFTDVKATDYFANAVNWAVSNGITAGTSANTFSPNEKCTRGQVMTFLWRANASPKVSGVANKFNDVNRSNYFYTPVLWAISQGITSGTSSTTFSPNQACTRGQVMTFLWRNAKSPQIASGNANPFNDVNSKDYFYSPVLWAVFKEITAGTSSNTFSPNATCTRAQIVTFLYKYMGGTSITQPVQEQGVPDGAYVTSTDSVKKGENNSIYKIEIVNDCVVAYGSFVYYKNANDLYNLDAIGENLPNSRYAFPIDEKTGFFATGGTGADQPFSSVNEFSTYVQGLINQSAKVGFVAIVKDGVVVRMAAAS